MVDILMVFLKEYFQKVNFEKKQQTSKSMKNYPVCNELNYITHKNSVRQANSLFLRENYPSTEPKGICDEFYEREAINLFWSIKNSTEILNKLKAKGFQTSSISKYDVSMLCFALPYDLIKTTS